METSRRLPSLNALRAFEAAARHLNFRLAAEELGVTQGAVAQQVRGLERDLATQLFERLPGGLALTSAGRGYAAQLARAFAVIAEATSALRPQPLQLTISVTPSFASKWLIPRLPAFTAAHPQLDLRILASDSLANFQSDGVDIAVRQGRPPFGAGLVTDLLFPQDVVAVCSPKLRAAATAALDDAELAQLVLLHDGHDLWPEFIERALARSMPPGMRSMRFNQTALALDAALAGQGLALASRFLVEPDLAAGRLVQAFTATMRGSLDFHVVSARKPRHPEPTAMVRSWLLAQRGRSAGP